MRIAPFLFAAGLLVAGALPAMAGPFDGKWLADIPAQGRCNFTSEMNVLVTGGTIAAQIHNPANIVSVTGTLSDDGNGTLVWPNGSKGTIRFQNGHFEANWAAAQCNRHAEGDRAPSDSEQAAAAEARKTHQAAFAELVRRAEAGEKIDYAKLRAESVYAENWNFYGQRINGLINQARVFSQGNDCTAALNEIDQVLALDYTAIEAHQIKSDCLKETDRARSRIESHIADGLDDSLLDSGDGESEKTAYIVATRHDEARILNERHYRVPNPQQNIQEGVRGSDGHFYDVVLGQKSNGVCGLSICTRRIFTERIYFDVTAYIAARDSKRAAAATAQAQFH